MNAFPSSEQVGVRDRLARMLRFLICQRLVPRQLDGRRVAVFETLKSESQMLDGLLCNPAHDSANDDTDGLDLQIERLVRAGVVSPEIALAHAIDPRELSKKLAEANKS